MDDDSRFSAPDAYGVQTALLTPVQSRARRQVRLRRAATALPAVLAAWPAQWQATVRRWLAPDVDKSRWDTLRGKASEADVRDVAEALLRAGFAELQECFDRNHTPPWRIESLRWLHLAALREALGLPARDAARQAAAAALAVRPSHPGLAAAWEALGALPARSIPARAALLHRLAEWQAGQGFGTQRDFAWFARGDTKGVSDAEWEWLASLLPLADWGISRHAPVLWLAGALVLSSPQGLLNLAAAGGPLAVTLEGLLRLGSCAQAPRHYSLIENRTSFERHSKAADADETVLWLPGYPSSAWLSGLQHLLRLAPASVRIACDPDPAGIAIAQQAGAAVEAAGGQWQVWRMQAADLNGLAQKKEMTLEDRRLLDRLMMAGICKDLLGLAQALADSGEKGEQEGYL